MVGPPPGLLPHGPTAQTPAALSHVCRDFMRGKCSRPGCRFLHDRAICFDYWKTGSCKFGAECKKRHGCSERQLVDVPDVRDKRDKPARPDGTQREQQRAANERWDAHATAAEDQQSRRGSKERQTAQQQKKRLPKNTQDFQPMTKPVDMRVVYDLGYDQLSTPLMTRDVLLVPNLFSDFGPGQIYRQLVQEVKTCGVPEVRRATCMVATCWACKC